MTTLRKHIDHIFKKKKDTRPNSIAKWCVRPSLEKRTMNIPEAKTTWAFIFPVL